jgi:hypothetical protein
MGCGCDGVRYLYGHGTPASCDMATLYYELAANAAVEEVHKRKVRSAPPPPTDRSMPGSSPRCVRVLDLAGAPAQRADQAVGCGDPAGGSPPYRW